MTERARSSGPDVELQAYVDVLRRRWRTIAVTTLILLVLSVGSSVRQEKRYTTESELLIEPSSMDQIVGADTAAAFSLATNADRVLNNQVQALNAGTMKRAVEEVYDGPLDPDDVTAQIGSQQSDLVTVSMTSTDPVEGARLVNLYVETFITKSRQQRIDQLVSTSAQVQQQIDDLTGRIESVREPLTEIEAALSSRPADSQLGARRDDLVDRLAPELSPLEDQRSFYQQVLEDLGVSARIAGTGGAQVLTQAEPPIEPVSPKPARSGLFGLIAGLVLGLGLAFLRDNLDERIRTSEDVGRSAPDIPILAVVPEGRSETDSKYVAVRDDRTSPAAEAFRSLRTSIKFAALDDSIRVIQVTSALAGEGKTTTVANLAEAFAQAGERVAVLCCDLRRPRIHERFGETLTPGFTDGLLRQAPLISTMRFIRDGLYLLPAGSSPPNPSELLSSERAQNVVEALAAEFDIVLVDSTPVLPVTDALVVSRFVDATIVVVDTRTTKRRVIRQMIERLQQVQAPIIGLVLNGVGAGDDYGYGYGYGYGSESQTDASNAASGDL